MKTRTPTVALIPLIVLSIGCSTVDRGDEAPAQAEDGEKWCYRFPSAAATELGTDVLSDYPEDPEYCYCTADPDNIALMWAELIQANA